jgi:hypothetical protein
MQGRNLSLLSLVLWLQLSGLASAATPPAKVVEQFIEAYMQGQFAASRGFTLERVNLKSSIFSNWLFGSAGTAGDAATADLFLSRKFTQTFRYTITSTTPTGDNQVSVSAIRTSPNLAHMFTWALAPKRGSAPYELIEAVDSYLTKVNFPVEESRMQFLLVREVDSWYISNVHDEKFVQLQEQLQGQTQISGTGAAPGAPAAAATGSAPGALPGATTTSTDLGRQLADAQFNATLQGFNRTAQGLPPAAGAGAAAAPKKDENEPGLLGKFSRAIFGTKKDDPATKELNPAVNSSLRNVREAIARYAVSHNGVPDISMIYDWKSLRRVVNQYGKSSLPATEAEAGFTFVDYKPGQTREAYLLVVDLREAQDGVKRVEIADTTAPRSMPR